MALDAVAQCGSLDVSWFVVQQTYWTRCEGPFAGWPRFFAAPAFAVCSEWSARLECRVAFCFVSVAFWIVSAARYPGPVGV